MSTGRSSAEEASSWRHGPGPSSLSRSEVHVWRLRLDQPVDQARRACRESLLALLGRYAGLPPGQVSLRRGHFGKPALQQPPGESGIQFNVSHSGRVGLIALAAGRQIGVDVEEIRGDTRVDDLTRDFFTAEERESLRGLEGETRIRAFYAAWTRKEAEIKACGGSIAVARAGVPRSPGEWVLRDLPVGDGYAAALCSDGRPARVALWEWSQAGVEP